MEKEYVQNYLRTLEQGVNVLKGISGVTQFNRTYNELARRLHLIELDVEKRGLSIKVLSSFEVSELKSQLFSMNSKLTYKQLYWRVA